MEEVITDFRIIRTLNMLHYAKTEAKKIVNELKASGKYQYININKSTEIEFYLISFSQLIYVLYETLNFLYRERHNEIKTIFENDNMIKGWKLFAQKIKHDNHPAIKQGSMTINFSTETGESEVVDRGIEYHNFTFKEGKTDIKLENMEEQMEEVHKRLLKKIKDFYTKQT